MPDPGLDRVAVHSKLRQLLGTERNVQVDFLLHLELFDREKWYEKLEYGTVWEYCRRELGLQDGEIFFRVHAMRLLRRYPQIEAYLRDGRLSMTGLVIIKDAIKPENVAEMLARASGKSVRDLKIIAAAANPPPEGTPVTIRKVPVSKAPSLGIAVPRLVELMPPPSPAPASKSDAAMPAVTAANAVEVVVGAPPAPERAVGSEERTISIPLPRSDRPAKVDPLGADLFLLTMRVPRRIVEKIDRVKKIRGHKDPSGDLIAILEDLLDGAIAKDAKKHSVEARRKKPAGIGPAAVEMSSSRGAGSAEATAAVGSDAAPDRIASAAKQIKSRSISIPADVAAIVWTRDGGRCQWALANGERCLCDDRVEYDHRISRAKGGLSTVENLWLLCREHNLLKARREFGEKHMERFTRAGRETSIDRSLERSDLRRESSERSSSLQAVLTNGHSGHIR